MRERICQLAGGEIHVEIPALELPHSIIEADIAYGQNYRGDIHISSGNQLAFRGLIYSDDSRVLLPHSTYSGSNVFIPYDVMADELEEGTVLEGYFSLVYNGGEYQLPYRFRILGNGREHETPLVTLEDFAGLAEHSPEEAKILFGSREFLKLPFMEDMAIRGLYDGLRRSGDQENLVEEFLCGTGTKERVILTPEKEKEEHLVEEKLFSAKLNIKRSTWGTLSAKVTADHPAVILKADSFTEDDFSGDTYTLLYTIDQGMLHAGRNLASITVETPLETHTLELVLVRKCLDERRTRKAHQMRSAVLNFQKTFLSVLIHQGEDTEELDQLQRHWDEMVQYNEPTLRQQLYHAAIRLWQGDRELASTILENAKPLAEGGRRDDVDAYCAYLYLQVQVTSSWERKEQMLKILRLYENAENCSEFVFLLMLHMEDGLSDRPMEMLSRIRGYYEGGSRSPFLYVEACRIYNRHPDILKKLEPFELHTLSFGAKHELLTEKVALHVASMAGKEKEYRPLVFSLLKRLYRKYEKNEILGGICQILIRGDRRTPDTFRWYALGVEKDIRLTRLYDYYLNTVPADYDEPLPREIMLYFSYNGPKEEEAQTLLYRNLYRYLSEDERLMNSYQEQLEQYVRRQILQGKVSGAMAEIDEKIFDVLTVDDPLAHTLPDVLHSVEVTTAYRGFTEAIAVYGETEEEFVVPVKDGRASVPVYSDTCRILFRDKKGARYGGIPCETRKLFGEKTELLERCTEIYPRHSMMRLAQSGEILSHEKKTADEIRFLKKELESRTLHRQYKKNMMSAIAEHVIDQEDPADEEVITCVRFGGITMQQRSRLVEILIEQGQLTEASRQAKRIGFRELPPASLLRLVSLTIQNGVFAMDETLLDMCHYLFSMGQCDELVLEYLCTHYNSGSSNMIPVLREAVKQNVSTHGMEERLLAQMLFTGERRGMDEVFRVYAAKESGERVLVHAYFAVKCDSYFIRGEAMQEEVFDYVRELLSEPEERGDVPLICVLALMRHYAAKPSLTEEESRLCSEFVSKMYRNGLQFAWMKQLRGKAKIPEAICQREWLEFHGTEDQSLKLLVTMLPAEEGRTPVAMVMPQVYPGIYVHSFLLFEGESMIYEIRREEDQAVLGRGTCTGQASPLEDHSRFAELNRLQARIRENERVTEWQQDVMDYGMMDAWTNECFTLDD